MKDKEGFIPSDQRLLGAVNVAAFLLIITATLLSLGYLEFASPQPEGQTATEARRWGLSGNTDHSKAYGHVVKNIADHSLIEEALEYQRTGIPLHQYLDHLRELQRSELEISTDLDALNWEEADTIETFFKRGKLLYSEMRSAHSGAMNEYSFLTRMLSKLPSHFDTSAHTISGSGTLTGDQLSLERAILFLKQSEVHQKLSAKRKAGHISAPSKSARTCDAGPSGCSINMTSIDPSSLAMFVSDAVRHEVQQSLQSFRARSGNKGGNSGGTSSVNRGGYGNGNRGGSGNRNGNQSGNENRGYGGGRGNGRGRGRISSGRNSCNTWNGFTKRCFTCGSTEHLNWQCPHRDGGGGSSFPAPSPHTHFGHTPSSTSHQHSHQSHGKQHGSNQRNVNYTHFHCDTPQPSSNVYSTPYHLICASMQSAFVGLHSHDYLADSAATTHISNNLSHFSVYIPLDSNRTDSVMTGAGPLQVHGYGCVSVQDEHGTGYRMEHVMYVPRSPVCLFSTIKLNQEGGEFRTSSATATLITHANKTLTTSRQYKGIYLLSLSPMHESHAHVTQATAGSSRAAAGTTWQQWHARLGHVGITTLQKMIQNNVVTGMAVVGDVMGKCMSCTLGKFKKSPYPLQSPPDGPLDLLYSDVCGPLPCGLNGHKYFVTVRDRFSGYSMVKTVHEKKEAATFIIQCIESLERGTTFTVKAIRIDRGGEYTSTSLLSYLSSKGIIAQHTATECSASNGTAERLNLTIMDRVRATLIESNQPRLLWPWIVSHVVTAMNYVPYAARPTTTPHEDLFLTKPDVRHLRTFGCKVVAHIPSQSQPDKLSARGAEGRLVGYVPGSTSMYQVIELKRKM